jgi:hypothetical protein
MSRPFRGINHDEHRNRRTTPIGRRPGHPGSRRAIIASTIGTMIEGYDLGLAAEATMSQSKGCPRPSAPRRRI